MASCVLTDVKKFPGQNPGIVIEFADGVSMEFQGISSVQQKIADVSNRDNTRACCIAFLLARSPDLTNLATVKNKTFTFDLTAANPTRVQ